METFEKSKEKNTKEESMYSQEAFRVSLFPPQEKEEVQKTTASSGERCLELYKLLNPHGSLLKTCVEYLVSKTVWYSSASVLTWKIMDLKSNRFVFQLVPSALRTDEIEYGLLLTPSATNVEGRSEEGMKKRTEYRKSIGRNTVPPGGLAEQIGLLPTVRTSSANGESAAEVQAGNPKRRLETEIAMLPTPDANMGNRGEQKDMTGKRASGAHKQKSLNDMVKHGTNKRGLKLQPGFAAYMMGFPENWTELPFQSGEGKA